MNLIKKLALLFFLLSGFLLFGCISNSEVSVALPNSTSLNEINQTQPSQSNQVAEKVNTFAVGDIGDVLTNGKLNVKLNSVEFYYSVSRNISDSFISFTQTQITGEGNVFAIVDVSVENIGDEPEIISDWVDFEIKDSEGYKYDTTVASSTATQYLERDISGTLQPGDKVRGKIAFEVPKNALGLQLIFKYEVFDNAQAKFNLGNAR